MRFSHYNKRYSILDCNELIVITPTEHLQTWGKADSGYPDNSTCHFFVRNYLMRIYFKIIVDDGSPNHLVSMNFSYDPRSNDVLMIIDEKGLNDAVDPT